MRLEELKTTLAIQSSLLTATLHKLSGVDGEVETEINHFETLPLKTMEDLNQLEDDVFGGVENHMRSSNLVYLLVLHRRCEIIT